MTRTIETVGVLGGTFDPVHLGHLHVASQVRDRLRLRRVLLVPAAVPPHKDSRDVASAQHRRAMLELALADTEGLELCLLELRRGGVSYTVDTLRSLAAGEPPLRPLFIVGLDALAELSTWREHRALLKTFDLVAVDRPERGETRPVEPEVSARVVVPRSPEHLAALDPGRGGRIFRVAIPEVAIASSEVRERIARGEPLDGLVPPAVARYIREHRLYR